MRRALPLPLFVLFLSTALSSADDIAKPRRPAAAGLSPKEAAAAMTGPTGFRVQLFAGEPDVKQPIAMALDDRGRLWIAEAYTYPRRAPEGKGTDRILIFEDTDGDGAFDHRTIFAEGLNLVSGLEVGFGGVWVGAAPYLLFIPDRNGDDKPDGPPEVLLDGWGFQDTHETLNAFIWGPDGWLYGCHGVFTHSNVGKPGTPDKERTRINAGIWRYHPTRHVFEVFAEGTSNPWGVDFNDRGHAFCTACVIPHLYHIIQGGRYQRQAGQHFNPHTYDDIKTIAKHRHWVGNQWNDADRAKSDGIGGGHAHAGAMIYLGGAWPAVYRDQLFMNNIHGARLNQDVLARNGSGYVGDAAPDFLFANDVWSQIINLRYGPDGQVYLIDWYDKNQCHHNDANGHDRSNGRIFKVVYGEPKAVKVDLRSRSDAELVGLQTHVNDWYVRHARRLLQERAASGKLDRTTVHAELGKLLDDADTGRRLRALWALHVSSGITEDLTRKLLSDREADVRAWAVQLACEPGEPGKAVVEAFAKSAADDDSPLVRLYLASALQRLPLEKRWTIAEGLLRHAEDANDHNLPLMIWYAVEPLVAADPARALALGSAGKIPLVSRYIVRRAAAEESAYEPLFAVMRSASPDVQKWMLEEVVNALRPRANLAMPKSWSAAYDTLMKSRDAAVTQQAEFVAVKFGDSRVMPGLRKILADRGQSLERRRWALESLLAGKDPELAPVLFGLLDEPTLRLAALNALASTDHDATPVRVLAGYGKYSQDEKNAAVATLTSRPTYVLALLDAIEAKQLPRTDLSAFAVRQLSRFNNETVNKRLNEVWGTLRTTAADKAAEIEQWKKQLTPRVLRDADLPNGRAVFAKTCGSCHTLFGVGQKIGPDLTGSNRADLQYILENAVDPSAVVGRDYQMTVLETKSGRVISGLIKEENDTAVTMQEPTKVTVVPKADIVDRTLSPLSMMPDGQLKQLKPDEVRDLIAYLASPVQTPLPGEGPWLNPRTGRVQDALEGESLQVRDVTGGEVGAQNMSAFPNGRWSGGVHLWWTGGKRGDELVLELPVAKAGRYEVFVTLTKARDYGIVQLALDGRKVGELVDLYNETVTNTPAISLGVHELKAGTHELTFTITGANRKAVKAYMVGLDYVSLIPRPAVQP